MSLFGKSEIKKVFISPPVLMTKRLKLRKIMPFDVSDMFEYSSDPETSRYLLWETHEDVSFTRRHIQNLQKEYRNCEFFDWGIEYLENGKFIGTVGFTTIEEKKKCAQVGYVLSPKYHRMEIAPEALLCIMDFAFTKLGLTSLYARFMEENTASRKVLEKCGFTEDEYFGDAVLKRGKRQRILRYSITKEEYENKLKEKTE